MKNPYSPDSGPDKSRYRNKFDESYSSLFTTEFGLIYPGYHQEVLPDDTIKIENVNLDIQGMPTYFPLLSPIHVSVSYYYCRNRNVHDEFEDFIFNTKDVELPWLKISDDYKDMAATGGLLDAFGLPTNLYGSYLISRSLSRYTGYSSTGIVFNAGTLYDYLKLVMDTHTNFSGYVEQSCTGNVYLVNGSFVWDSDTPLTMSFSTTSLSFNTVLCFMKNGYIIHVVSGSFVQDTASSGTVTFATGTTRGFDLDCDQLIVYTASSLDKVIYFSSRTFFDSDATDTEGFTNPFLGSEPAIRINALLPRHYEMICNYYFRNDKNNPYILDGEPQYNKFIPSTASGSDSNYYGFHYRNYELDRFTSATQSPQFGEAPLVGLTYNIMGETAELTFQDSEDVGHKVTVGVDTDGNIVNIANFDQETPSANLRKLTELINYGISINDLRVTNSFQRFLENTLRRGLRYRNQLRSHFGTSVDYPDIDVPQYIGGFSGAMNAVRNENMTASEYANLGDFNGSLFGNFQLKHPITFHCPEHGFVIGLVTITPIPSYPQACNTSLLRQKPFDFFQTEFGKIGHVPMHFSEVMPLTNEPGASPDDVFGYQKAWYDYMNRYDEVHGDFRTSLRQFTIARFFGERPELSEDFTTVHPEELNKVFIAENIADKFNSNAKFLCRIHHGVTMLRQIPIIGTPSLE